MTEGIIQKVISKYRLKPTWNYEDLEQELIVEIEKLYDREFNSKLSLRESILLTKIEKYLIGDNQE